MFTRSAATNTLQGRAIQSINERWGNDFRSWNGHETIGIPVCKKKYAPFDIRIKRGKTGKLEGTVHRAYGCHLHSHTRKKIIQKHGERKGWEPFGQWSLRKARKMAKKEIQTVNERLSESQNSLPHGNSSDDGDDSWKHICRPCQCRWKLKGKYDDVFSEIHNDGLD